MATHNDITGDALISRVSTQAYKDNFDRIGETTMATTLDSLTLVESRAGLDRYVQKPSEPVESKFKIYHCDSCHVKVSTSNGKCPGCGKDLAV